MTSLDQDLLRAVASQPLVYDLVQLLAGARHCFRRLKRLMPEEPGQRVLDVGGGTGRGKSIGGQSARYVAVDIDPSKLSRLRRRHPGALAVCADASALPVKDGAFDVVICALVCHHLETEVLREALSEMSRVCRGWMIVLDPLELPRLLSRLLWRYDRGACPRGRESLLQEIGRFFELERVEEFTILHRYVLCRGKPRRVTGGVA